jgi:hypothetical protein
MAREVFHVSPAGDGIWRVEAEGGGSPGPLFDDKQQAVHHAKERAKAAQLGQIIVHRCDGRIEYENTYGEDPRARKG